MTVGEKIQYYRKQKGLSQDRQPPNGQPVGERSDLPHGGQPDAPA